MGIWYHLIVELETKDQVAEVYQFWTGDRCESTRIDSKRVSKADQTTNQDWRLGAVVLESVPMSGDTTGLVEANFEGAGIIHLFRSGQSANRAESQDETLARVPGGDTTVGILFVPSYLTSRDMLFSFLGEEVLNQASHFRIVRSSEHFLVLVKFRTPDFAQQFREDFDGRNFNKIDPGTCHVVQILEIRFQDRLFPSSRTKSSAFPMMDPFTSHDYQKDVELPTCPVCLERLDSDVTGLATIPCQHTFHCHCLNKWKDSRCPVCRYSELKVSKKSLVRETARCSSCGSNENLWICVICGNIGCGRYNYKHAVQHFTDTGHFFAMEMATQRVWDYAGDNYVHRLVQNEEDGKLVEVGSSSSLDSGMKRDKQYHLEYVQVLLSQLESQRDYYENKLLHMSSEANIERPSERELATMRDLQQQIQDLKLNAAQSRSKAEQCIAQMQKQMQEEKTMSEALQSNLEHLAKKQTELQEKLEQNAAEKQELQEQVRDLMFFLESKEKFKDADEDIKQGTVTVKPVTVKPKKTPKKRK
ncbi:LAME_0G15060g1_1 [Lachancea meyersii CBS 8951]|uniref:LAME_0G15060g1_1 n=1 Tax=Lachancea meyersii CBS 8951 TaxID=1266667 RepID=A0A1G4KAR7_9SACH|nr:LAME_0G15060g1_1 [Lachancea meyersii CBS 8951]